MNYKGETTIQLFNAKTGELECETHDCNMVTNAVENLLNPPIDLMFSNDRTFYDCYDKIMPLGEKAFAGVVLLSNFKEENADKFMLDENDKIVGHAGENYSGTNNLRGTLNTNESKKLENGYKWVWDFASDRAVGDISCVGLTHIRNGNAAKYNGTDNIGGNITIGSTNAYYSYGLLVGIVQKGLYCFIKYTDTTYKNIQSTYARRLNRDKISLKDTPSYTAGFTVEKTININTNYAYGSSIYYYSWVDENGILTLNNSGYTDSDNLYYCKINILTGELIGEYTLTLQNPDEILSSTNTSLFRVFGNYVITRSYLVNSSGNRYVYGIFSLDGQYIKHSVYAWSSLPDDSCYYDRYKKALYFGSDEFFTLSGETIFSRRLYYNSYSQYTMYYYEPTAPYFIWSGSSNYNLILGIDTSYLATINNLSTTVTKTNGQTMKVTYTITET